MNKVFNSIKSAAKACYKAILAKQRDEVIAFIALAVGFSAGFILGRFAV